jgi:uncharacterized protein
MHKLSIAALIVILASSCASSKKVTAEKPFELEKTLLWEISGKDLSQPSYLFGTMHLLCADDAKLSDSLRYAIRTSKQVYFEIDLDNMVEMVGAMRYLNMNNNTRLSDLITEAEYKRVKDYFSKNKTMLPLSMMERMKPYFITSLISESKFPCPTKDGMEQVIMKEAKKDGKKINGLETVKFQASVFDSIPYQRQAKDLVKMIDSSGKSDDDSDAKLIEVYRAQDLNKMQELTAGEEGLNEYLDLLLYNRNANWAKKMPEIMTGKQTLFAVGAGHLGGEKGVINLLRKEGFTVRPVTHKPSLEMNTN